MPREQTYRLSPTHTCTLRSLKEKVRRDLEPLDYPNIDWLPQVKTATGRHVYDVVIVGAGQGGLAVGLALQGSLANFAAGFLLIIFRPFKVGNYIEAAGVAGTVEAIQIFTTELATPDNKTIIVPNSKLTGDNIVNYSTKGTRRVDMVFGIGYEDDIDKARDIVTEILSQDERVLKDPPMKIAVSELADSSVNFIARPWSNASDYWGVYWDTTEKVKKQFDAEGISIPFPQRDVHVYEHKVG